MVQICKQENCPKPSHQTSTHRVCLAPSRAGLFSTAQHWQILPGFPLKRLQHSHTPLLYLLEWSGGPPSFSRACKHPSTFLKDRVLQNTAHRKASCSCSRWAEGRTEAYKEQVPDKTKVGPLRKGLTRSSSSAHHNWQAQGRRLWPPTRRSLGRDHTQTWPAQERKGLFC